MNTMQCVIFCGGYATRMYPLTTNTPKSMLEVAGKPFLEHQLGLLAKNGVTDIFLLTGFLQDQIIDYFGNGKKFGVSIRYIKDNQDLGTAYALKRASLLLENEFLTMYGDSYLLIDHRKVMSDFLKLDKLGMVVVYENHDKIDRSMLNVKNGLVSVYDPHARENKNPYACMDFGLQAFRKKVLDEIPNDPKYTHGQLWQKLIAQKQLAAYVISQRPYEIGSFRGLEEVRELIQKSK